MFVSTTMAAILTFHLPTQMNKTVFCEAMMKRIHRLLISALCYLMVFGTSSCDDSYGDSIRDMGTRITVLETSLVQLNRDIELLYYVARVMSLKARIVSVRKQNDGSYLLIFEDENGNNYTRIIKNGDDGSKGPTGDNGKSKQIVFGIRQYIDGYYYWTLNGSFIHDANGMRVRADGYTGKDGEDGQDAAASTAIVPQVRINSETRYWEISTDGGITWVTTDVYADGADGENGQDGENGKNGEDGQDGVDGIPDIFQKIFISDNGTTVTFVLADGQTFVLPIL